MRLLSLTANQPTFRSVTFHRQGLSIVLAEQKSEQAARTKTYNGVGKSLLFELLTFCLGSNKNHALERHLPGWVFNLALEGDGRDHLISRATDPGRKILLDGAEVSLKELKDFLGGIAFVDTPTVSHLTFRSIVSRFIRSGRSAYNDFYYVNEGERKLPFLAMLGAAFCLGLDLELAKRKYDLRVRREQLADMMRSLERDPLFAELLANNTLDIELAALRERAQQLERDLSAFRVAEDYHTIELEANRLKGELDLHRRESVKISVALEQIDRSLKPRVDFSPELVERVYREAQRALPDAVTRTLAEVTAFHADLEGKRLFRLSRERQRLIASVRTEDERIRDLSAAVDDKLRYLSEHRALDEYLAVSNELVEVGRKIAKVEEGRRLRETVTHELNKLQRDLAQENVRADEYIESVGSLVATASKAFRDLATELYGSRPAGLAVSNDAGDNQQRYKIEAQIAGDASEGINEAKIFCFDTTMLALQRGHRFRFLAHDSTLFQPVDPRQRLGMFRIADRLSRERDFQYIAAVNKHDLTSIRQQTGIDDTEYERLFGAEAVVLRLTDGAPEEKLLGIDVNMNYLE